MALLLVFVITAIVLLIVKALIGEDSSSPTQPTRAEEKEEAWTPPQTFDEVVLTFAKAAYALSYCSELELFLGMDIEEEEVKTFIRIQLYDWESGLERAINPAFLFEQLPDAMKNWIKQYIENEDTVVYRTRMPVRDAKCSDHYDRLICGVSNTCRSKTYQQLRTRRDEIGGAIVAFPKREFQL